MGRQVLLIEDDRVIGEMYSIRLRQDGWRVQLAASGEEGLAVAAAQPPDLVLLDIMLPGIDGLEVLAQLRRAEATAGVPVLVLSNSPGLNSSRRRAEALGIAGWRIKADTVPSALASEVARLLA